MTNMNIEAFRIFQNASAAKPIISTETLAKAHDSAASKDNIDAVPQPESKSPPQPQEVPGFEVVDFRGIFDSVRVSAVRQRTPSPSRPSSGFKGSKKSSIGTRGKVGK